MSKSSSGDTNTQPYSRSLNSLPPGSIIVQQRCDCGQLAVTAIPVTVLGIKQKMNLCADCLAKERAQVAMGYTQ